MLSACVCLQRHFRADWCSHYRFHTAAAAELGRRGALAAERGPRRLVAPPGPAAWRASRPPPGTPAPSAQPPKRSRSPHSKTDRDRILAERTRVRAPRRARDCAVPSAIGVSRSPDGCRLLGARSSCGAAARDFGVRTIRLLSPRPSRAANAGHSLGGATVGGGRAFAAERGHRGRRGVDGRRSVEHSERFVRSRLPRGAPRRAACGAAACQR